MRAAKNQTRKGFCDVLAQLAEGAGGFHREAVLPLLCLNAQQQRHRRPARPPRTTSAPPGQPAHARTRAVGAWQRQFEVGWHHLEWVRSGGCVRRQERRRCVARWQPYELALGQGPTLGDALGLGLGEIQAQRGVALNGGCGVCGPVASLGVRRDDRTLKSQCFRPVLSACVFQFPYVLLMF